MHQGWEHHILALANTRNVNIPSQEIAKDLLDSAQGLLFHFPFIVGQLGFAIVVVFAAIEIGYQVLFHFAVIRVRVVYHHLANRRLGLLVLNSSLSLELWMTWSLELLLLLLTGCG